MSLRPHFCGFDLKRFRSMFGSRDAGMIAELETRRAQALVGSARPPDAAAEEAFRALLRRAVDEGAPFPDLEEESFVHVQVASALAELAREFDAPGSDFWTWRAFRAFWADHAASLDPRGRALFGCFLKGRPVFGKTIASDTYYGFLNLRDLATLRDSLRQRGGELTGDASAFVADIVGGLDAIESRGLDLWFHFL